MRDYTGHTVLNGELMHASVSSVKAFDIRTKGGCPRRWAYGKVFGNKADAFMNTEVKDKGTALDLELKNYLRTGDKTLSSLALKGLHILEAPGADLGLDIAMNTVEHFAPAYGGEMVQIDAVPDHKYPSGTVHKVRSALTAAGVPFVGELDLAHARGHFRDDDGEYYDDPPGTVEVADIKFKTNATDREGNSLYFLPTDMIRDVQMSGYGEWVRRVRPETTHIRLSMLYFPEKKGLPTKVTRLHVLEDFPKAWARTESVVREMKDVARVTDIEQVPGAPDTSTCDAYSGCPHREYCSAYGRSSLDKIYGKVAEDHLQEKQMGLLTTPPQGQPMPVAQNAQQPDMRQQIAAEEAAQRAAVAQQQQQMPQQINLAELGATCARLSGYGYGFPTLADNAAAAFGAMHGQQVAQGATYPGTPAPSGARRSLHGVQLTEVAHIYQLEGELSREAAQAAPTPTAPQPQYVPAAPATAFVQPVMANPALSFLPPDAPQSMPALAMQGGPQQAQQNPMIDTGHVGGPVQGTYAQIPPAEATATPAPKAKSPGRPKKNQDATTGAVAASAPASPSPQPAPATQAAPVATSPSETNPAVTNPLSCTILVNARSARNDTKSLNDYVDYINRTAAERYNVSADGRKGILDVRAAMKDTILAFGGWPGVLRELVKAEPPPAGMWHLDTNMDSVAEAVADALRIVADVRGWDYFRGMRG